MLACDVFAVQEVLANRARPFGPQRMSNSSRVGQSKFSRLRPKCLELDVLVGVLDVSCLGTLVHILTEVDSLLVVPQLVMLVATLHVQALLALASHR